MKLLLASALLPFVAFAAPTMVQSSGPGVIIGGTIAQILAFPLGGPLWVNSAASSNRPTNEKSTPSQYTPIAIGTGKQVWGSKENNIPVYISYHRLPGNKTTVRTVLGIWKDRNILWDGKMSAVNLNLGQNEPKIPENTTVFTRTFQCSTSDRLVPMSRAYLYIKAYDNEGSKNEVMSDRFTTEDNRLTAGPAGAFFTIQCVYQSDEYGKTLPARQESVSQSDNLPVEASNVYKS